MTTLDVGNSGRPHAFTKELNSHDTTKEISPELKDANVKCTVCNRCFNSCPEGTYRRHG